jgi:AraC-like DNA-binding protein
MHTPLQIQEEIIGYLILSAWRNEADSGESLKQMWIHAAQEGASSSWDQWRKAWQSLPTCNDRQQDAIARTLQLFADEALHHAESETLSTPKPSKLPPVIRNACTLIQEEYAQPLNLKQVAARCHISPEHLSRLFHHSTGMLFRDYLAETRIQAVCHLLTTSTDSISDIAANTGFSTLSRFNRSFRESTGTTPRQWRKHHLKRSPDRASSKK